MFSIISPHPPSYEVEDTSEVLAYEAEDTSVVHVYEDTSTLLVFEDSY